MRERPILFSGPMVRAVLDGHKTQTRRVVKRDLSGRVKAVGSPRNWHLDDPNAVLACPYGVPGDRLWVRETHLLDPPQDGTWDYASYTDGVIENVAEIPDRFCNPNHVLYSADEQCDLIRGAWRWRPSIHMPRWASRIDLRITEISVEPLQSISEADARAEGVDWAAPHFYGVFQLDNDREDPREVGYGVGGSFALDNFRRLWDSINARRGHGWDANPWVWVVSFVLEDPDA
jgi:hypothetical protein